MHLAQKFKLGIELYLLIISSAIQLDMADGGQSAPQPPLLYHQWYPLLLLYNCLHFLHNQ